MYVFVWMSRAKCENLKLKVNRPETKNVFHGAGDYSKFSRVQPTQSSSGSRFSCNIHFFTAASNDAAISGFLKRTDSCSATPAGSSAKLLVAQQNALSLDCIGLMAKSPFSA